MNTDSYLDQVRYLVMQAEAAGKRHDWDTWLLLCQIAQLIADTGLSAYQDGLNRAFRIVREGAA